jgi:hypothetical protein
LLRLGTEIVEKDARVFSHEQCDHDDDEPEPASHRKPRRHAATIFHISALASSGPAHVGLLCGRLLRMTIGETAAREKPSLDSGPQTEQIVFAGDL